MVHILTIDQRPTLHADPPTKSDWFAVLRTDGGIYIMLQIGYQATETEAQDIVRQLAKSGD